MSDAAAPQAEAEANNPGAAAAAASTNSAPLYHLPNLLQLPKGKAPPPAKAAGSGGNYETKRRTFRERLLGMPPADPHEENWHGYLDVIVSSDEVDKNDADAQEKLEHWIHEERSRCIKLSERPAGVNYCGACAKLLDRKAFCHLNVIALQDSAVPSDGRDGGCPICSIIFDVLRPASLAKAFRNKNAVPPILDVSFDATGYCFWVKLAGRAKAFEIFADADADRKPGPRDERKSWLPQARRWLAECQSRHGACTEFGRSAKSRGPTRLLDVRGGRVRLVEAEDRTAGLCEEYAVLSYCWGVLYNALTTSATLSSHLESIDFAKLPRTLQDAITATRELGIDYIWIDALCIVQDDEAEWEWEAAQMSTYYQSALLCISALDSPSVMRGFLDTRRPLRCELLSRDDHLWVKEKADPWYLIFRDAACNKRGWTMQERLLSRRVLHFTKREIIWECLTCSQREGSEHIYQDNVTATNGHTTESPDFKRSIWRLGPDPYSLDDGLYALWFRLIKYFTARDLTKSTDKLSAIGGIPAFFVSLEASENAEHSHGDDDYFGGIWKSEPHSLLWNCDRSGEGFFEKSPIRRVKGIPKWSWASIKEPVSYRFYEEDRLFTDTDAVIEGCSSDGSFGAGAEMPSRYGRARESDKEEKRRNLVSVRLSQMMRRSSLKDGPPSAEVPFLDLAANYRTVYCQLWVERDIEYRIGGVDYGPFDTMVYLKGDGEGNHRHHHDDDSDEKEEIDDYDWCGRASLDGALSSSNFNGVRIERLPTKKYENKQARFRCTALCIGDRRYDSYLHPNAIATYFLLVVPHTSRPGCWRRIGMGLTREWKDGMQWESYPNLFHSCPRNTFRLV